MDITLTTAGIVLVPIVMAIVQLVKMYLDSRWSPLVAIVAGIVGSYLAVQATWMPAMGYSAIVLTGILAGLTAAGLYSGVKTTIATPSV